MPGPSKSGKGNQSGLRSLIYALCGQRAQDWSPGAGGQRLQASLENIGARGGSATSVKLDEPGPSKE